MARRGEHWAQGAGLRGVPVGRRLGQCLGRRLGRRLGRGRCILWWPSGWQRELLSKRARRVSPRMPSPYSPPCNARLHPVRPLFPQERALSRPQVPQAGDPRDGAEADVARLAVLSLGDAGLPSDPSESLGFLQALRSSLRGSTGAALVTVSFGGLPPWAITSAVHLRQGALTGQGGDG